MWASRLPNVAVAFANLFAECVVTRAFPGSFLKPWHLSEQETFLADESKVAGLVPRSTTEMLNWVVEAVTSSNHVL